MISVTILIPTYNEEKALPHTLASLTRMMPEPDEILLVDGGSEDRTMEIALAAGIKAVTAPRKGRAVQINHGVELAQSDVVCVLHADSILPDDAVAIIRATIADQGIALASFTPRLAGPKGTRWGSTFHNWVKTWYAPLLTRPLLFIKGVRLLFGDHAMFFRREHFLSVGGCDERVAVMEEADLCIKLSRFGRTKMVPRWVWTSDRRISEWGRWRANWIYFKVGMMWALGARERLADHYPDVR
jgi:glycosyltransferase involved in cell wall biosynthesis